MVRVFVCGWVNLGGWHTVHDVSVVYAEGVDENDNAIMIDLICACRAG